jgi:hypothetical protein
LALAALLPFATGGAVTVALTSLVLLAAPLAAFSLVPLPLSALVLLIVLTLILLPSH